MTPEAEKALRHEREKARKIIDGINRGKSLQIYAFCGSGHYLINGLLTGPQNYECEGVIVRAMRELIAEVDKALGDTEAADEY